MAPLPLSDVDLPSFITSSPLAHVVLGNPLYLWVAALGALLVAVLVASILLRVGTRLLRRLADHTSTRIDDALVDTIGATRLWLIAIVLAYPAAGMLTLGKATRHALYDLAVVAFFLQFGLWGARLLHTWIAEARRRARDHDPAALSSFGAISFLARAALWSVIALLALDNLGINVSALVAGLGIGGIAIGLALQNILGDLFASLSIVLDKPFAVGDFIIIDNFMGTVENIGVKTTRLRSLDGELLVFSNGDLTKSRLRNYKQMAQRRILFGFGVRYDTTAEQLEAIPGMVREIVEGLENTRFDRAHFKAFGGSSLDFEVVFWMLKPDYNLYMDAQQAINLALFRRLADAGIGFAFPSQSIYFETPMRVENAPAG
jgi:small-conductance mechanosensitive channel